jgi:hypothetical protein
MVGIGKAWFADGAGGFVGLADAARFERRTGEGKGPSIVGPEPECRSDLVRDLGGGSLGHPT